MPSLPKQHKDQLIKITGTRSYILVEFISKTVKIEGELTTTPAFYASVRSIKNWGGPDQDLEILPLEKKQIIEQILAHNNPDFKIIFVE
jgi:hypothetical protein